MTRLFIRFRTDKQGAAVQAALEKAPEGKPEIFVLCPLKSDVNTIKGIKKTGAAVFADLPFIARESDIEEIMEDIRSATWAEGLVLKNVDEIGIIKSMGYEGMLIADSFLYVYNSEALGFIREIFPQAIFMAPDELTDEELSSLPEGKDFIYKVYGRARVMLTAQSISANYGAEGEESTISSVKHDRFISADEDYGYSCVYTAKPVSMPEVPEEGRWEDVMADLTIEGPEESAAIIKALLGKGQLPAGERGHHFKGID